MPIEWFDGSKSFPTVTVASYGLTLNTSAAELVKGTHRIKLGLDSEKKRIYLKPVSVEEEGSFAFSEIGEKTTNIRVSCKEFIQFVAVKCNLAFNDSEKYYATWEDEDGFLIIDLNKKVNKTRKRQVQKAGQ